MDYNEFAEQVKSKYPDYVNVDNKTLAEKMVAKYPEYKEQVSFEEPMLKAELAKEAVKTPKTNITAPADNYTQDVNNFENKYGDLPPVPDKNTLQGKVEKNIINPASNIADNYNPQKIQYDPVYADVINNLNKRQEWEENHPIISSMQKNYQPMYRTQEDFWNMIKENPNGVDTETQLDFAKKLMAENSLVPVNVGADYFLGRLGYPGLIASGAVNGLTESLGDIIQGKDTADNLWKKPLEYGVGSAVLGGIPYAAKIPVVKQGLNNAKELLAPIGNKIISKVGEIATPVIDTILSPINRKFREASIKTNKNTISAENKILSDDLSPNISKSEDPQNISKKSVQEAKKEFKDNISEQMNEKRSLNNSMITNKTKNGFYKSVADPVSYDMEYTARNINDLIKQIKKHPEIVNNEQEFQKIEEAASKEIGKWADTEYAEFATEQGERFWNAYSEAVKFNKINENYNALSNRQIKIRGAVKTVAKKVNNDVANAITDKEYLTRGLEVNKQQLENMSDIELQNLINSDEISDLSVTAKALDINKDLENGKIPLYKLNKWANEGTPIGQAMQARSLLNLSTPSGALSKMITVINEAAPKVVKNLKKDTKNIIDNVVKTDNVKDIEKSLSRTITNGKQRKTFAEKLLKLKNSGELNEESFTRLVDKHYKVPEITDVDLTKINELTSNLQNATGDYDKKVAEGLLNKYIADKVPKKFWDKVNSYRYQNMLLSSKSRTKDALLTGLNTVDTAIDEGIASIIDAARSKITNSDRVISGLHPKEWFNGIKKGFKEGVNDVKLGINTSRSGEKGRYGLPSNYSFEFKPVKKANWEGIQDNPIANAINNAIAGGERALNYSIRVPDRMFYEGRYASSLADQMEAAGLNKPTDDIIAQAVKEAKEAVYQDDSWVNKLGLGIRKGLNTPSEAINGFVGQNVLPKFGDWIEPFVTTPANIANQGLKNTGGAIPAIAKILSNKNMTPEELREAEILLAKNVKGILPILTGVAIGKGVIDSNIGDNNYAENEVTGLKPQSIVVGDKAFSLKDYPQWSIPISFGQGVAEGGLTQGLINAGKAVTDMSSLKSLGDLVGTVQGGFAHELEPSEILDNAIRNQGINAISQLIPYGGAMGELRNDIDPYSRELYTENTPEYILNRITNRIPLASTTLPQKYNAVGEPVMQNNIKNPILRALSEGIDVGIRNYKKNNTYTSLNDFADSIKGTDIKGRTTVGLQKSKRNIKINGENVKLTNKQYSNYQKEYGKLNYVLKKQALNSEQYKKASNEERAEYLGELRRSIEEAVKIKQFGHKPLKKYKSYTNEILDNYDTLLKE